MDKNWEEFIRSKKNEYKLIGKISCPAFENELVHFNKHGFVHLQWKGRVPRPRAEQRKRFSLLPVVITTLNNSTSFSEYRQEKKGNSFVHYWAFQGQKGDKKIRIILRRRNQGILHFYSVIEEK